MNIIHQHLSLVEWIFLATLAALVVSTLVAVFSNIAGLKRYFHIKRM